MAEPRMTDHGYHRKRTRRCDECGSEDLNYIAIKGYVRCDSCRRLYSSKHKFNVEVE